ncbi:tyrosine-type recombinase/integrase [Paraliobacillus ryukyuensis]|uniref:tyrosine-type recombinase/integrase n=1 Tax=Paraliobacillus ryukyuensis TaxID=200904 RepID=UPI0009A6DC90|nr:site-specific integrase [Paraliobacillus ryukyuensis]
MNSVLKIKDHYVYDDIQSFTDGLESENTKRLYNRSIKDFLEWKHPDKEIHHLSVKDINDISYIDVKKYREKIRRKSAAKTVNAKMSGIYSFFVHLSKIKFEGSHIYNIDHNELKMKKLKETDSESYGYLSWDEITVWMNYLKDPSNNIANGDNKAIMLHLARMTGLRKQALVNLKYKDLKREDDTWVLTSRLKGKKIKISLKDEDAELLLNMKETNNQSESILKMSYMTIDRTLNMLKEVFEVPEDRKIAFHSIRGTSGWEAYKASGNNIIVAKEHLGHEHIETTYNYIKQRESMGTQPTLYMGEELDHTKIELNKDQWNDVFDQLERGLKYDIINKAKELGYLK